MITTYTTIQWVFFFYLYSFLGWCYESAYVSIKKKQFVNRGFMLGPFLPLYGSGAIMMLIVSAPFRDNLLLTYVAGCIGATLLEYITGVTMEALFKVRYWDYSQKKFNFQGHICLGATLAWGLFTIIMTRVVHAPIEALVLSIPDQVLRIATVILSIYIVADFSLSFKTALDLRDVLVKMDHMKDELVKLQKRVDVMIAFATGGREKEEPVQNMGERADAIIASLEDKLRRLKEMLPKLELSDEKREEIADLLIKFGVHKERRFQLSHMKDFYRRAMIKGNPSMVSVKFKEALEEVKKAVTEGKNRS